MFLHVSPLNKFRLLVQSMYRVEGNFFFRHLQLLLQVVEKIASGRQEKLQDFTMTVEPSFPGQVAFFFSSIQYAGLLGNS